MQTSWEDRTWPGAVDLVQQRLGAELISRLSMDGGEVGVKKNVAGDQGGLPLAPARPAPCL